MASEGPGRLGPEEMEGDRCLVCLHTEPRECRTAQVSKRAPRVRIPLTEFKQPEHPRGLLSLTARALSMHTAATHPQVHWLFPGTLWTLGKASPECFPKSNKSYHLANTLHAAGSQPSVHSPAPHPLPTGRLPSPPQSPDSPEIGVGEWE